MEKIINHLVQLQELTIVRAQQKATSKARLKDLDESIRTMKSQLPDDVADQFNRLEEKGPICIAPVSNSTCTACGIALPMSFVQAVRAEKELHRCTHCARILYYSDGILRRSAQKKRRFEAPKVGIARFSSEKLMIPNLKACSKEDIITQLCTHLKDEGFIEDKKRLKEATLNREGIMSTAVDYGLAFPHVRGVEGGGLTLLLAISKKGVPFDHPTGRLTRIFFFMVIPTAASAFYLKLLSGLSETFKDKAVRDEILECKEPSTMWKTLIRVTHKAIP